MFARLLLIAGACIALGCGKPNPPPPADLPQVQPVAEVAPMPRAADR